MPVWRVATTSVFVPCKNLALKISTFQSIGQYTKHIRLHQIIIRSVGSGENPVEEIACYNLATVDCYSNSS